MQLFGDVLAGVAKSLCSSRRSVTVAPLIYAVLYDETDNPSSSASYFIVIDDVNDEHK